MNANLMGFLAILIFSIGTLIYALLTTIPVFQFMVMQFVIGALSITSVQVMRGKNVLADWRQPLISVILFILFGFKPTSPLVAIGGALIVLGCIVTNADQIKKLVKR